jgi:hypothetical protein
MDTAIEQDRQVILASHSPELLVRVPGECLRWVERDSSNCMMDDMRTALERLGVTPDVQFATGDFPQVIVYVEGKTDRPVIENLLSWYRQRNSSAPSVTVVTHRDGRFEAPAIQSISRVIREMKSPCHVIGIRDLDWYYYERPSDEADVKQGEGWTLLTLPCKELENLFCEPEFLYSALEHKIPLPEIERIVHEESSDISLLREWGNQVKPKIRQRLASGLDDSTKEDLTDRQFEDWKSMPELRWRLVAGKELLKRIRARLRREYGVTCYPARIFQQITTLTPIWNVVVSSIFLQNTPPT